MEEQFRIRVPGSPPEVEQRVAANLSPSYAESLAGYTGFKPCYGRTANGRFEVRIGRPSIPCRQVFAPHAEGRIEAEDSTTLVHVTIHASRNVCGGRGGSLRHLLLILWLGWAYFDLIVDGNLGLPLHRRLLGDHLIPLGLGALLLFGLVGFVESRNARDMRRLADEIRGWFPDGQPEGRSVA